MLQIGIYIILASFLLHPKGVQGRSHVTPQSKVSKSSTTVSTTTEDVLDKFQRDLNLKFPETNNEENSTTPSTPSIPSTEANTTAPLTTAAATETSAPVSAKEIILENCEKLPTRQLKASCKNMANNEVWSTVRNVAAFVDKTGLAGARSLSFGPPGAETCERKCPTFATWMKATEIHERSFSPWTYCNDNDLNRLPQWISQAQCNCDGCMDPVKRKHSVDFSSVRVYTIIPVLVKESSVSTFAECNNVNCWESTYKVSLGCHCQYNWP